MTRTRKKSDLSRAFSEDGELKTHVGGQALIEGIMMRGKYNWAVAVREPDGNMYVEEHDLASGKNENSWLHKPVVRGCTALVESLMLGYKALEISADHAFPEEDEEPEKPPASKPKLQADENPDEAKRSKLSQPSSASAIDEKPPTTAKAGEDSQPSNSFEVGVENPITGSGSDSGPKESSVIGNVSEGSCSASDAPDDKAKRTSVREPQAEGADGVLQEAAASARSDGASATSEPKTSEHQGMVVSMIIGVVLAVAIFIVAPMFLANLIVGADNSGSLLWNVVEGVVRVAVFILYVWLIGLMKDIRRMYRYHGAEHKTIHCYEHGLPLTPENARDFPRLHVRCGTAFLIMVMIIAIIVYTILGVPLRMLVEAIGVSNGVAEFLILFAVRIVFLPVIAGLSYEVTVRWAGSHPENPVVKVILWPGLQMQYLTTGEPDDSMLECAIAAMQRVLDREEAKAREKTTAKAVSVETADARPNVAAASSAEEDSAAVPSAVVTADA